MKEQNIQVFARCRPLKKTEVQTIINLPPADDRICILHRHGLAKDFFFDQIFPPSTNQEDIYNTVVKPMTEKVLDGNSFTILAYGETGTGKTYTMEGNKGYCGLIPRSVSHFLNKLRKRDSIDFTIRLSFFELHNEGTFDLFSPEDDIRKLKTIETVPGKGSIIIGDLTELEVNFPEDISRILDKASQKRLKVAKSLRSSSSLSHNFFNITIHIREKDSEFVKIGKLSLVDLAGESRKDGTGNVNHSIPTLRKVIANLAEAKPHIPYYESKLTRILRDSLGGTTYTSIIATISPADEHVMYTEVTLKYASRARSILNKPIVNQQYTQAKTLHEFHQETLKYRTEFASDLTRLLHDVRFVETRKHNKHIDKLKQFYKDKMANLKTLHEKELKEATEIKDKVNAEYELRVKEAVESQDKINADYELKLKNLTESLDKANAELQGAIKMRDKYCLRNEELITTNKRLEKDIKEQSGQLAIEKQKAVSRADSSTLKSLMECCEESNLDRLKEKLENLLKIVSGQNIPKPPYTEIVRTKVTQKTRFRDYENRNSSNNSDDAKKCSAVKREASVGPGEKRAKSIDSPQKSARKESYFHIEANTSKPAPEYTPSLVSAMLHKPAPTHAPKQTLVPESAPEPVTERSPAPAPAAPKEQKESQVPSDNYVPNRYLWTFAMHGSGKENREWPPPRKRCFRLGPGSMHKVKEVTKVERIQTGITVFVKFEGIEGDWPVEHYDYWKLSNPTPPLRAFFDANEHIKQLYRRCSPAFLFEAYRIDQASS